MHTVFPVFVKEDKIYALVEEYPHFCVKIRKYKPESTSWEDVPSFEWRSRRGVCIVSKDNFIYFLGGKGCRCRSYSLRDADRYNLNTNRIEKVAEMRNCRYEASGVAVRGKIFVIGGIGPKIPGTCEVYNETTNEWQFIPRLTAPREFSHRVRVAGAMCVDEKLYVLGEYLAESSCELCRNTRHRQA